MHKYKKLFCFGDSWGYGSELNFHIGEVPFANIVSKRLKIKLKNYSVPNMSLGLILRTVSMNAEKITSDDLVLIVVPPDSRWYTEKSGHWETLDYTEENKESILDKSDDWFIYHHQLFIYSIGKILEDIGCDFIFMHNYGKFPLLDAGYFFSKYYADKFLSEKSLTSILTDASDKFFPIETELRQGELFYGVFFKGCRWHPNKKGHSLIADLILKKINV